jgi:hypothetical protein
MSLQMNSGHGNRGRHVKTLFAPRRSAATRIALTNLRASTLTLTKTATSALGYARHMTLPAIPVRLRVKQKPRAAVTTTTTATSAQKATEQKYLKKPAGLVRAAAMKNVASAVKSPQTVLKQPRPSAYKKQNKSVRRSDRGRMLRTDGLPMLRASRQSARQKHAAIKTALAKMRVSRLTSIKSAIRVKVFAQISQAAQRRVKQNNRVAAVTAKPAKIRQIAVVVRPLSHGPLRAQTRTSVASVAK